MDGRGNQQEFSSRVSAKGQITLPAEVRRELGIHPKDQVSICVEDGTVKIRRVPSLRDYFMSVPALDPPRDWKEVERIAHEDAAEEAAREGLLEMAPERAERSFSAGDTPGS